MPWTALIGGLIAGAATGAMNYASARQSQQETVDSYKHRYQWQVEDMRKAGLNPVLSGSQGAGSVGPMATAHMPDMASSASQIESMKTQKATQAQSVATAAQLAEQAKKTAAETRSAEAQAKVDEAVSRYYENNPNLAAMRANTEAGLRPTSPIGAAGQIADYLGSGRATNDVKGLFQSSANQVVHEGGSIIRYLSKPKPKQIRSGRWPVK